ncbi:MAG: MarR family winged helix-turn-helix transcriptional regulator, partial [Ruthenibacterium lactatiformans]
MGNNARRAAVPPDRPYAPRLDNYHPQAELSKSQFGTLMALAYLGGRPGTDGTPPQAQGLPLTQLAHVMHQSPPALSQRIAVLEAMGYVQRTEDAQDRRVTRVCLTQQGHALLKQAY